MCQLRDQRDNAGWYILQLTYSVASDLLLAPQVVFSREFAFIPVQGDPKALLLNGFSDAS